MPHLRSLSAFGEWWNGTGEFAGKGATMKERKEFISKADLPAGLKTLSWSGINGKLREALFCAASELAEQAV